MDEESQRTWIAYQYPTILSLRVEEPLARKITTAVRTGRYTFDHVSDSCSDFAVPMSKAWTWAEPRASSTTLSK
jgi:hypothetical protein